MVYHLRSQCENRRSCPHTKSRTSTAGRRREKTVLQPWGADFELEASSAQIEQDILKTIKDAETLYDHVEDLFRHRTLTVGIRLRNVAGRL